MPQLREESAASTEEGRKILKEIKEQTVFCFLFGGKQTASKNLQTAGNKGLFGNVPKRKIRELLATKVKGRKAFFALYIFQLQRD